MVGGCTSGAVIIYCLLWLLQGGIVSASMPHNEISAAETEKAKMLMETFWRWHLQEFPEFATEIGIKDYDDMLTEHTEEAFERRARNATLFLKSISDINHAHLDHVTRVNLLVMDDSLSTYVEGFRFRFLTSYQRFQIGLPTPVSEWSYLLSHQTFRTETDYENLLVRYSLIPKQFEQLINLTSLAMRRGYMRNTDGIEQYQQYLAGYMVPAKDTIFYRPFLKIPPIINKEKTLLLQKRAESIIKERILPAIWKMWFFVSKKYAKAAENVPIGLYGLSEGKDLYRRYLNYHLSIPMTPEQVHQIGLAEVRNVRTKITKLQQDLNFTGDLGRFVRSFFDDQRYYFNDSETMLDAYKELSKNVERNLHNVFLFVTNKPYTVQPTFSGPPGSYEASHVSGKPATFFANVRKPYGPSFLMPAIFLHEATPGHHTEATYLKYINATLPKFRFSPDFNNPFSVPYHFPTYSAYIEGWGMYAESLGSLLGVYDDHTSLLGYYISEMLRACRLVVDTGIHAYGWTRQAAEEYLSNNAFISSESVATEVSRYISRPGQACSYKIGQMKIMDLRRRAKDDLGKYFDLRKFHHKFLSLGPVPLQILEEEIHSWIAETLDNLNLGIQDFESIYNNRNNTANILRPSQSVSILCSCYTLAASLPIVLSMNYFLL